jgi:hypothetical protein
MLIVIEGHNLAGKTTLAEEIKAAALDAAGAEADIWHYGVPDPPDRDPLEEYELDFLREYPDDPGKLIICDRFSLGDLVYGPLFRGKARMTAGQALHVEMLLASLGACKIMMMASRREVIQRYEGRGDELVDLEDIMHEREMYAALGSWYRYARWPPAGSAQLGRMLRAVHDEAVAMSQLAWNVPGYIGTRWPDAVLAGDVRGGSPDDGTYVHAFTPAGPGSAEFLMGALDAYAPKVLEHIGILNTGEAGMHLDTAHSVLGRPKWIALGSAAARRLAAASQIPEFDIVRHPSHVRRFGGATQAEYGSEIMTMAGLT